MYEQYSKCERCGKYDIPESELSRGYRGGLDTSMKCDGRMTLDVDPFAQEIHGDNTLYWDCEGSRYESAMDI